MATQAVDLSYTLNEADAQKILSTPLKTIKESNVFNDLRLSENDRIKHAADILRSRK